MSSIFLESGLNVAFQRTASTRTEMVVGDHLGEYKHMKINLIYKLHIGFMILAALTVSNVVQANSIQFAIDASLEQQDLDEANRVVTTITNAASNSDSIGIVVYDSVFQRGAPIAAADAAQKQLLQDTLTQITAANSSNLAVGIEKGTSELRADGGQLIIFGHSEIQVSEPEKLETYSDWLKLVLLPDAKNNNIDVVIVGPPPNNVADSFQSSVTAFFELTSASSMVEDIATLLPDALVERLDDPTITIASTTNTEPGIAVDSQLENLDRANLDTNDSRLAAVTIPEISTSANELETTVESPSVVNEESQTRLFMIGMATALFFALAAIAFLVFKLTRSSKIRQPVLDTAANSGADKTLAVPTQIPPSFHNTTTARDDLATFVRHDPVTGVSTSPEQENCSDVDQTAKKTAVQPEDSDSTVRKLHSVKQNGEYHEETQQTDDLEEIRELTKRRVKSLI